MGFVNMKIIRQKNIINLLFTVFIDFLIICYVFVSQVEKRIDSL